jgi:two-component system sensor histidine kinase EvgS
MRTIMARRFFFLVLVLAGLGLSSAPWAQEGPGHYRLLARSLPTHLQLALTTAQERWLDSRHELVLGTSAPDYPPFDMTTSGGEYEGLSADYAGIIGEALGLRVRVERFASRDLAERALMLGQIDLLASANGYEAANHAITLSSPYATDRPVLVTRVGETRSLQGLQGMRLSMVYHYLPEELVALNYPGAILRLYPSYQNALNAVAFEEADVFLGDTLSTHYLMDRGYLRNVQMANFGKLEPTGFSFAIRADNATLLELVNTVLLAVPTSLRESILKRWSNAGGMLLSDNKLQLSEREERWRAQHPVVNLVVDENLGPLTFFDSEGNLRGITADLLDLIAMRTGLQFKAHRARSIEEMTQQLSNGQADLIAAILPSEQREKNLSFTRPYLENSFVLITTRGSDKVQNIDHLENRKVAITRGNPMVDYLRREHADIRLVETDNTFQSLRLLAAGEVGGAVSALVTANYLLAGKPFQQQLQISSTLGTAPAAFSMATARGATELGAILDKALLSIGPQELAIIHSRWRSYDPSPSTTWQPDSPLLSKLIGGTGALMLSSLVWVLYMRRQIKKRERAERALHNQFEFMTALVNGTPHPIYVRDRDGLLLSCNDSYLQTVGVTLPQVLGKTLLDTEFGNCPEARKLSEDYRRVMAEGAPLLGDRPLRIGDRLLSVYHWTLPYRDSNGLVCGVIGGWIDISERRDLLEQLSAAKDQADAANSAKSTFLATMSHEIRTPMNAIIGMLELALKRADQRELDRPALEVAYHSAKDLLALIGDILDIARIESGRLSLSPERVNLREQTEAVMRVFDGLARQKNLQLLLELDTQANRDVLIDPLRFKQVLSNLVSNAIKFTEEGHVRIRVDIHAAPDAGFIDVHLCVEDTGIGIDTADQAALFQPFVQVGQGTEEGRSGTGLGLVISEGLCKIMGATLHLESQPGTGTRVHMNMRMTTLEPAPAAFAALPAPRGPLPALRVLVVDDHPANRLLMAQQLEFMGLRPITAQDGIAGLQAWQREPFDVVIVDCNMPRMNGYDLARAIREQERIQHRPGCAVLGYTANAQPEEHERCRQAGMDDCMFKPISLQSLEQQLRRLEPVSSVPAPAPGVIDLSGLDLLTGGDASAARRLLEQVLDSCRADRAAVAALNLALQPERVRELAHAIKGAARIIRAQQVIDSCEQLELAWANEPPQPVERHAVQALLQALTALEQGLLYHLQRSPAVAAGAA